MGFELLDESGLLAEVLPEIKRFQGVQQPPEYHPEGDVWIHTLMMLEGLQNPTATLALGVLLHDVGKPPTFTVRERIRFDGHVEVGVRMAEEICIRLRLSTHETRAHCGVGAAPYALQGFSPNEALNPTPLHPHGRV